MSDSSEKPLKRITIHKTTPEDFIRFLDEKAGPDDPCPVCGHDGWTIICPSEDDEPMYRLGTLVRNVVKPFYLSTFAYHCTDCGYVRHHLSRIVHDWVSKNPLIDDESVFEEIDPEGTPDE